MTEYIEDKLLQNFHYRLARESNQLGKILIITSTNPLDLYLNKIQDNIQIKGNVKIEPVVIVKELL